MKQKIVLILLVLALVSATVNAAELRQMPAKMLLQRLDNYIVSLKMINDNTVHVTQSFDIVSRHKDPIIPGRAKLILYNGINPRNIKANIGGSMKDIPARDVIEEDGNNVIYYEIWRPITPGERLNIQVDFETDIITKGFLFKQLDMKFGEPELPIDKMVFSLTLPQGKRITFAEPELTAKGKNSGTIEFEAPGANNEAALTVEYSSLPLPTLPFHGYWLWMILVIMSLALFFIRMINKDRFNIPSTPFSE